MQTVTIHYNPAIPWHKLRMPMFFEGLKQIGISPQVTTERTRRDDSPAILFGTSGFKNVEAAEGKWLLVDRACWGDPEMVCLGWNGHALHANYCVKTNEGDHLSRFDRLTSMGLLPPEKKEGSRIVLCGDFGYTPKYLHATHFRPHPQDQRIREMVNPQNLPVVHDFEDCKLAVVGTSTVAFEALLAGIEIHITNYNAMAAKPLWWVAHTQWSWDEIADGHSIAHLFN